MPKNLAYLEQLICKFENALPGCCNILYTNSTPTAAPEGDHVWAINSTTGDTFYKNSSGVWQQVMVGGLKLKTNSVLNPVQNILDLVDSETVSVVYEDNGKVSFNVTPASENPDVLQEIHHLDTNSVKLLGEGTLSSPLTAAVIISPTVVGNILGVQGDGLYVVADPPFELNVTTLPDEAGVTYDSTTNTLNVPPIVFPEPEVPYELNLTQDPEGEVSYDPTTNTLNIPPLPARYELVLTTADGSAPTYNPATNTLNIPPVEFPEPEAPFELILTTFGDDVATYNPATNTLNVPPVVAPEPQTPFELVLTTLDANVATYDNATNTLNVPPFELTLTTLGAEIASYDPGTNTLNVPPYELVLTTFADTEATYNPVTNTLNVPSFTGSPSGDPFELVLTTNGTSGASAYNPATNTLNVPIYGGGAPVRFGIEDNLGIQDRAVNMQSFNFEMNNFESTYLASRTELQNGKNVRSEIYADATISSLLYFHNVISTAQEHRALVGASNNADEALVQISATNRVTNKGIVVDINESIYKVSINDGAGSVSNQIFSKPLGANVSHFIPLTVNNIPADAQGNITIPTGGGGGAATRFGIEDNLGVQNRFVAMDGKGLKLENADYFQIYKGGFEDTTLNPAGVVVSEHFQRYGVIDMMVYKDSYQDFSEMYIYEGGAQFYASKGNGSGQNLGIDDSAKLAVQTSVIRGTQVRGGQVSHQIFPFNPDNLEHVLAISVNGNYADAAGNITISTGGGGGGYELNLTTNGTSGASTYDAGTDTLNVPIYDNPFWFEVTKAQLDAQITASTLVKGGTYRIADVHPNLYNDGVTSTVPIVLQAISINQLALEGKGYFQIPIGTNWTNISTYVVSGVVGLFNLNEAITNDLGGTATLFISNSTNKFIITGGTWTGATTITGTVSGATANITTVVPKVYNIGDKVKWGGYVWTNTSGAVGSSTNTLTLSPADWTKVAYNTTDYFTQIDSITYNIANNIIVSREDKFGNIVVSTAEDNAIWVGKGYVGHPISVFLWGAANCANNHITNSYADFINHTGNHFRGNRLSGRSSMQGNTFVVSSIIDNIFTARAEARSNTFNNSLFEENTVHGGEFTTISSINSNNVHSGYITNCYIRNKSTINSNTILTGSFIYGNILEVSSQINSNFLRGANNSIYQNTVTVNSQINSNTLTDRGIIVRNRIHNSSKINTNICTGNTFAGGECFISGNDAMVGEITNNILTVTSGRKQICANILRGDMNQDTPIRTSKINACTIIGSGYWYLRGMELVNSELQSITVNNIEYRNFKLNNTVLNFNNISYTSFVENLIVDQRNMEISFSKTFTGGVDFGAIGNVSLPPFPIPTGYFIDQVLVDTGTGLTGAGAIINFGFSVDAPQGALNDTTGDIAVLNTNGVSVIHPASFTKATVARVITMEVKTAAITAGTITIKLKLSKLA